MSEVKWQPIETAPRDGTVVFLYWPTLSITAYPAVGVNHDDGYGWEWLQWRDYGEVIPTHWMPIPLPPSPIQGGG
jgi:hypothetical protein